MDHEELANNIEVAINDLCEKIRECSMSGNPQACAEYASALCDTARAWQSVVEAVEAED